MMVVLVHVMLTKLLQNESIDRLICFQKVVWLYVSPILFLVHYQVFVKVADK